MGNLKIEANNRKSKWNEVYTRMLQTLLLIVPIDSVIIIIKVLRSTY